jgi:peptide/nickel transport system substrate-binding protein
MIPKLRNAQLAYIMITRIIKSLKSLNRKEKDAAKEAKWQSELDKKLVYSLSKSRLPSLRQMKYLGNFLNPRELWILRISSLVIIMSLIFLGTRFYMDNLETVPVSGGKYSEGLIGSPKYINPLYASLNDVDGDLSRLIFSSLLVRDSDGGLEHDLAEGYGMSEDGKTYTVEIKEGVKWHDGKGLTADDVIFTFNTIKDNQFKSPLRAGLSGVQIQRTGDNELQFLLSEPYAAFPGLLTFGIMPSHLWMQTSPESASLNPLNLKPIGSGPYMLDQTVKDSSGNIKELNLVPNGNYYGKKPYVNLGFYFFPTFEEAIQAINNNAIDAISYLPQEQAKNIITPKTLNFHKMKFPQLTVLFLNQNKNEALKDKKIRQALAYAINRQALIDNVLSGNATKVDSPILENSFAYKKGGVVYDFNRDEANKLLDEAGWTWEEITEDQVSEAMANLGSSDEKIRLNAELISRLGRGKWRKKNGKFLIVKISTVERNENPLIIDAIAGDWKEVGVKAESDIRNISVISNEVIRPRNFDALFYGQIVGADPDPYAFWHSSQTGEDGFNISGFSNKEADALLEEARLTSDIEQRKEKYARFQDLIAEEAPAIFMYSPLYVYPQSKKITGFNVSNILLPNDRFANISDWYIKTGKRLVW